MEKLHFQETCTEKWTDKQTERVIPVNPTNFAEGIIKCKVDCCSSIHLDQKLVEYHEK